MKRYGFLAAIVLVWCTGCTGTSEPETKNDTPQADQVNSDTAPPGSESGKGATPPLVARYATYTTDIAPVFKANCVGCHTGPGAKNGIDLSTYEGVMKGGKEGAIAVVKDPANSMLIKALKGKGATQMPKNAAPLAPSVIFIIETWIRTGARK